MSDSDQAEMPVADVDGLPASHSALSVPFFRALWSASFVSNIGTLMHGTASAWLMTTLTDSPLLVGLVQTAATLPALFAGLPGGVLADLLDRRVWLMITQGWMLTMTLLLGLATVFGKVTPAAILVLTFLLGIGMALHLPSWQAMVHDVVPRRLIASAVSLNSVSFNLARSIGPAVGGVLTGLLGAGSVFLINAASFLGPVGVLAAWKGSPKPAGNPTPMLTQLREGATFVWTTPTIRSAMSRAGLFVVCASFVGALLPLIARDDLDLPAMGYGALLGVYGLGSVSGALFLPRLRERFGVERVVAISNGFFCVAIVVLIVAANMWMAGVAILLAGYCWSTTLVSLNVTVQMATTASFRGRAMSFYLLTFQGAFACGGLLAGVLGSLLGLRGALAVSAAIMLVGWLARGCFPLVAPEGDGDQASLRSGRS